MDKRLLKTGIIGTVIAFLCCFSPLLVLLFGLVGLSALVGRIDFLLMPALIFFIGLTIYALIAKRPADKKPGNPDG